MKQSLWECPDETAAEVEMGEFLYGFVRILKPMLAVETGTYRANSSKWLHRAVAQNGMGRFITCDPVDHGMLNGLMYEIDYRQCSSVDLPELAEADFIFSDSDYQFREKEIAVAKPGAVIVVHDTAISYDSSIPPLEGLVKQLGGITFSTYRGFGILKKEQQ